MDQRDPVCREDFTRIDGKIDEQGRTLSRHAEILERHADTLAGHEKMLAAHSEILERLEQTNRDVLQKLGATQLQAAAHSEKLEDVKLELERMNTFHSRLIFLVVSALIILAGAKQVLDTLAGGM